MNSMRSLFGGFGVATLVALFSWQSAAQDATPSHVYQVVDDINAELALLLEADESVARKDETAPELTARKPRHVIQKAREMFLKLQTLRRINGLPATELQPFPVRAIKPADVKGLVSTILSDLRDLREPFAVTKDPEPVALMEGITPTDVYRNLVSATAAVDSLGVPQVVPNDVYRVALAIVSDLKKIRAARGLTKEIPITKDATGKKPGQVYELGVQLIERLAVLTQNEAFAISGGVVLPNRRQGKITPAHVIDILNNAQAEVVAMKLAVGANEPTEVMAPPAGKTPSDVFDALEAALEMIESLQTDA